ncbi:5'-methylthioadenosine/adenosylhomocysteine nucleosidase [Anaerosalibacter bizertensis]|uniref:5'-methylthioadenosine/adenosylhomocysteine nucleosidase n=1 Tax=Anaerosalibacter bizertensis TaxID=932217 RepID=UPI001756A5DE|nr:5'-methylthioadenosine/adenosylhomocysteine nucleosidase [Anaerosalibacter bizertensis]MBU5292697.1 5'-methylthioadenosine/adenosylhomocysteine nucleosidase [Anaerosalibacter bizertensis]HHV26827.1 5'-methylthioadenosine/adenosylhomocysteine nucleosidase [Tissierellia bacterium]
MDTVGIIGAMELEIKLLKEKMYIERKETIAGFNYYIGRIEEKNVIVTCCGVGKVNAASCTQALIDNFNVDCIVNTGIAGGLYSEVKICDVVISKDVTYHDVDKRQMKNCFPFKEYFEGNEKLIELAIKACKQYKHNNYKYHIGRIVSGESFISNSEMKKSIIEEYSPYCVEMEGAAIGHVSYINNIPFVVIRCISDNADDEADINYNDFEKISAEHSANIVFNMMKIID